MQNGGNMNCALKIKIMKTAKEIKEELENNFGWNFSSEENMEMYYDLFLDVQKVALRQPLVVGRSEKLVCDVCGSTDVIEAPHMGRNCNRCHPL
jgi:formylmethanofuran dehydrogenase subunit E